ncbi:MAG: hypothetical protein KAJ72_08620, partial [Candidatus Heimdallarchaeota archaeon]|nr:hypothetical protein [Candidatus Heimdallarchaeota archaeon]
MHGLPKGKRKVFRKDNIIQQIILGVLILASVVFAFLSDEPMLKFLAGIMLAIVAVVILSYYMLEFFTGKGYVVASAINEALYLILGIPILVIAAGFLPV